MGRARLDALLRRSCRMESAPRRMPAVFVVSGRLCDLCGAPTPYTDWTTCESCAPLNAIGHERQWDAAKAAVERVRAAMVTDNHTRDAERMQGIRERAERYANGGHRFEPRDVIYVLCELDAERDRTARELAASKHCEKHPEPYT